MKKLVEQLERDRNLLINIADIFEGFY